MENKSSAIRPLTNVKLPSKKKLRLGELRERAITKTESTLDPDHRTVRMTKTCSRKLLDFKRSERRSSPRDLRSSRLLLRVLIVTSRMNSTQTVILIATMRTKERN